MESSVVMSAPNTLNIQVFATWFPSESARIQNHPFCNNANAAIRRELWEQLPYNEELTGLEDLDWAKRSMALGSKVSYAADAEIIHVHQETYLKIYNRYRREAIALKHIFPEEHFNLFDFVRLFPANVVHDLLQAWRDRLIFTNAYEIVMFRLMQFWGTYRGFSQQGPVSRQLRQTFYYPRARLNLEGDDERESPSRTRVNYTPPGAFGA